MGFFNKLKGMVTGKKNTMSGDDHSFTTHHEDPREYLKERRNSENSLR